MARKPKAPKTPAPDAGPPPEKPKVIQITSVKRTRKSVIITHTQGDAKFTCDESDLPLPSFYAAFDALAPLVGTICHFHAKYSETGMRVIRMDIGEKGGVQTVSLHARKDIDDAMKEFALHTPERLLAHPSQEGKYTPPLVAEDVALVEEMIEQAKQYVFGNRAQGQISFPDADGDDDGDEDDEGGSLQFEQPAAAGAST